jgi:hypothetical protein
MDVKETEPIKVQAKPSGVWWLTRSVKKGDNETTEVKEEYIPDGTSPPARVEAKSESGVVSTQVSEKPSLPSRSNSTDSMSFLGAAHFLPNHTLY